METQGLHSPISGQREWMRQFLGDMLDHWQQIGAAHGFTSSQEIAKYLVERYEMTQGNVSSSASCTRCHAPLNHLCPKCQQLSPHPSEDKSISSHFKNVSSNAHTSDTSNILGRLVSKVPPTSVWIREDDVSDNSNGEPQESDNSNEEPRESDNSNGEPKVISNSNGEPQESDNSNGEPQESNNSNREPQESSACQCSGFGGAGHGLAMDRNEADHNNSSLDESHCHCDKYVHDSTSSTNQADIRNGHLSEMETPSTLPKGGTLNTHNSSDISREANEENMDVSKDGGQKSTTEAFQGTSGVAADFQDAVSPTGKPRPGKVLHQVHSSNTSGSGESPVHIVNSVSFLDYIDKDFTPDFNTSDAQAEEAMELHTPDVNHLLVGETSSEDEMPHEVKQTETNADCLSLHPSPSADVQNATSFHSEQVLIGQLNPLTKLRSSSLDMPILVQCEGSFEDASCLAEDSVSGATGEPHLSGKMSPESSAEVAEVYKNGSPSLLTGSGEDCTMPGGLEKQTETYQQEEYTGDTEKVHVHRDTDNTEIPGKSITPENQNESKIQGDNYPTVSQELAVSEIPVISLNSSGCSEIASSGNITTQNTSCHESDGHISLFCVSRLQENVQPTKPKAKSASHKRKSTVKQPPLELNTGEKIKTRTQKSGKKPKFAKQNSCNPGNPPFETVAVKSIEYAGLQAEDSYGKTFTVTLPYIHVERLPIGNLPLGKKEPPARKRKKTAQRMHQKYPDADIEVSAGPQNQSSAQNLKRTTQVPKKLGEKSLPGMSCEAPSIFTMAPKRKPVPERSGAGKPYICHECGMGFNSSANLRKHMRVHSGEKPFHCEDCGKSFTQSSHLKLHQRSHTGEKPYLCSVCGASFIQSGGLKIHMGIHSGEKPFRCDFCDARFLRLGDLNKHLRTHTKHRPFTCKECGAGFTASSALLVHRRTHTGDKPYKCHLCDTAFAHLISLTTHVTSKHAGSKPYQCNECGKAFSWSTDLTKHKRTHSGEKPYQCSVCHMAFARSDHLKVHMRKHTGDKPYVCDLCGHHFSQSGGVTAHKRKKHAEL